MTADIDMQHIAHDRLKTTNFPNSQAITPTQTFVTPAQESLARTIDAEPFIPKGSMEDVNERLDTILNIQATGLAMRLRSAHIKKVIIGLSGGLDSTLALIAAKKVNEMNKTLIFIDKL